MLEIDKNEAQSKRRFSKEVENYDNVLEMGELEEYGEKTLTEVE